MSDEPVRLGYVGCGFMAQNVHLPNFASLEGCRLVALAEARPRLACLSRRQYLLGLRDRDGHGLLHEDVLAGAQQVRGDLALLGEAGRDADRLNGRIGGEVEVAGIDGGDGEARRHPLGQERARLRQRQQRAAGERGKVWQVDVLGHEAAANVAQAHRFVAHQYSLPFRYGPMRVITITLSLIPMLTWVQRATGGMGRGQGTKARDAVNLPGIAASTGAAPRQRQQHNAVV